MNRVLLLLCVSAALPGCVAQMKEARIRTAFDEIWHQRDLDKIDQYYAPGIAPEVRQYVNENLAVWPDAKVTIDDVLVDGDQFTVLWTAVGPHRDYPGKTVTLHGATVDTYKDGKVVDEQRYFDQLTVYSQLGFQLVPPDMVPVIEDYEKQKEDAARAKAEAAEAPASPDRPDVKLEAGPATAPDKKDASPTSPASAPPDKKDASPKPK